MENKPLQALDGRPSGDKLLKIKEVMDITGESRPTVSAKIASGQLPAFRLNGPTGERRVWLSDLLAAIEATRVAPALERAA
jgi:predicted DNA-binding transcriptional regulator AlpA